MGYGADADRNRLFGDAFVGQQISNQDPGRQAQRRNLENTLLQSVYGPNYTSVVQNSGMGGGQHFQDLINALYGYKSSSGFGNTLGNTGMTPGDNTFGVK